MGRFSRKSKDRTQDRNGRAQTLVIQNGQVDEQTRAQLRDLGLDPDRFETQMKAFEKATAAKADRS